MDAGAMSFRGQRLFQGAAEGEVDRRLAGSSGGSGIQGEMRRGSGCRHEIGICPTGYPQTCG